MMAALRIWIIQWLKKFMKQLERISLNADIFSKATRWPLFYMGCSWPRAIF